MDIVYINGAIVYLVCYKHVQSPLSTLVLGPCSLRALVHLKKRPQISSVPNREEADISARANLLFELNRFSFMRF